MILIRMGATAYDVTVVNGNQSWYRDLTGLSKTKQKRIRRDVVREWLRVQRTQDRNVREDFALAA